MSAHCLPACAQSVVLAGKALRFAAAMAGLRVQDVSVMSDHRVPACAQSVVLAGKALALAAAAAAVAGRDQALTPAVTQLLRCLAVTAAGSPVAALRNGGFLALDAVLSALQV